MDMIASIIQTNSRYMLVRDFKTNDEVIVLYNNIHKFSCGDCVKIKFDGNMTFTMPPRVIASSICEIECPN